MCRWSIFTWKRWRRENDDGDNENHGCLREGGGGGGFWYWNSSSGCFYSLPLCERWNYLHGLRPEDTCDTVRVLFCFLKGRWKKTERTPAPRNGLFHYSASLPWMSHPAGCSLDKTMPSQGIALQRQKGLASIHRNIGMPPCYFIHIKD